MLCLAVWPSYSANASEVFSRITFEIFPLAKHSPEQHCAAVQLAFNNELLLPKEAWVFPQPGGVMLNVVLICFWDHCSSCLITAL